MDTASHNFRHAFRWTLTIVSNKRVQLEWEEERSIQPITVSQPRPISNSFPFFPSPARDDLLPFFFLFFFRNSFLDFVVGMLGWALSLDLILAWAESLCYFPKGMFRSITPALFLCWCLIPFSQKSFDLYTAKDWVIQEGVRAGYPMFGGCRCYYLRFFHPSCPLSPFFRISWLFNRSIFIF